MPKKYNYTKKTGRPLEYDKDLHPQMVREYLASCVDKDVKRVKTDGEKSTSWELGVKVSLPCIEGLSLYLDVSKMTIYDWEEKYPEFSYEVMKVRSEQGKRLLENGLSGKYNPLISKLLLSSAHGYREKSEVEQNSHIVVTGYEKLTDEELDNAINEYHRKNGGAKADPGKAEENKSQSA